MSKKYIFIDTNIYVYCSLLTKDDEHNSELIEQLNSILENNKDIILLVPEVVKLEYVRVSRDTLKVKLESIKKLDKDISVMNSMLSGSEKKKMTSLLKDIRHSTEENHRKVNSSLEKIFNSKAASFIEITPQILTDAYKRAIAGKKPFSVKKVEEAILHNPINADCVIFETILTFFKTKKIEKGDKLVFCTNNTTDFSNEKKDDVSPDLKEELPIEISFYSSIPKMIKSEFKKNISNETIKEYQNLTESMTPFMASPQKNELYTLSVTQNQLGALQGLGVNLFANDATILQAVDYGVSPLLGNASPIFINQQRCITCGSTLERSVTDIGYYDRCMSCRNFTSLSGKSTS